jgi:hypothetical protein
MVTSLHPHLALPAVVTAQMTTNCQGLKITPLLPLICKMPQLMACKWLEEPVNTHHMLLTPLILPAVRMKRMSPTPTMLLWATPE